MNEASSYGPVPMGCDAYCSPRSSTAFFDSTKPEIAGSVVRISGAKGVLSRIVPSYGPSTRTSFRCGDQSPTYGLSTTGSVSPAVRSYVNFTSSAVSSP